MSSGILQNSQLHSQTGYCSMHMSSIWFCPFCIYSQNVIINLTLSSFVLLSSLPLSLRNAKINYLKNLSTCLTMVLGMSDIHIPSLSFYALPNFCYLKLPLSLSPLIQFPLCLFITSLPAIKSI